VNRLYGPNEQWVRAAAYASDFRGGSWPEPVSEFQISRWETAAGKAPYRAICRYEEVLGLRPGLLVAAADNAYRSASGVAGVQSLDRGVDPRSAQAHAIADELLERATTADVMSGHDWDRLTSHLVAFREAFVPQAVWTHLAERLLSEQLIARSVAWYQRYESFNRLLAHGRAQQAAMAACAAVAADPTYQVRVEPMSVLDASDHAEAGRLVLRELTAPSSVPSTFGALIATLRKTQLGHFDHGQLNQLQPALVELIHDPTLRSPVHALAVELLRQLPDGQRRGAGRRLHGLVEADATLQQVFTAGSLAAPDVGQVIVARVVNRAVAGLPRHVPGFDDDVLPQLIDDALHNPDPDVRLAAGQHLGSSPYRGPVADAIAAELTNSHALTDPDRAPALLWLLGATSRESDRVLAERLLLSRGLPPTLTTAAARAVGHFVGTSGDEFFRRALNAYTRAWRTTRSPLHENVLRGLVYAFGIARNVALLQRTAGDTDLPGSTRQAAAWWMDRPALIYRSARD